jgi:hypothetical protein
LLDPLDKGLGLVREVIRIETMTDAGRVNLSASVLAFLVPLGMGVADLAQVIIRIWEPDYETGLPLVTVLLVVVLGSLACVTVIAAINPKGDRGSDGGESK